MAILNYGEHAKRDALEHGLSQELKDDLTLQDAPDNETFLQFAARLNRLDNRLRACAQELRSTSTSWPPARRIAAAPPAIPMAQCQNLMPTVATSPGKAPATHRTGPHISLPTVPLRAASRDPTTMLTTPLRSPSRETSSL